MKNYCLLLLVTACFFLNISKAVAFDDFGVPTLLSLQPATDEEKEVIEEAPKDAAKTENKINNDNTKSSLETSLEPEEDEEITIFLPPDNAEVTVPNFEHIPYFFSDIQILPDGDVKITETIIFIVKGNIIKTGINRLFPKTTYNRLHQPIKGDVKVISVIRNNQIEPFDIRRTYQGLLLTTGNKNLLLEKGVHTYEISYIARKQVSMFNHFDDFFWNITGAWNLVITRVGARIKPPLGAKIIEQKGAMISKDIRSKDFISFKDSDNSYRNLPCR